ncbi:hypothetical protein ACTZMZ_26840, partial [Klebsiella pneumoniae]
ADRNRSHWSTSKTPSYTKSVSWQHHQSNAYSSVLRADKHRARQAAKRDIKNLILDSSKSFMN